MVDKAGGKAQTAVYKELQPLGVECEDSGF